MMQEREMKRILIDGPTGVIGMPLIQCGVT